MSILSRPSEVSDEGVYDIDCSELPMEEQARIRMAFSTGKIKITPVRTHAQPLIEAKVVEIIKRKVNEQVVCCTFEYHECGYGGIDEIEFEAFLTEFAKQLTAPNKKEKI